MDVAEAGAVWLHTLSAIVVFGYYGVLGRVVMPALSRRLDGVELGRAILAVEREAIVILIVGVAVFGVTGGYLLLVDDQFSGLGEYFESTWSTLMLAKHILVGLMIAGGVLVHVLTERLGDPELAPERRARAFSELRLAAEGTTGLGALIVLLTAAAQAS